MISKQAVLDVIFPLSIELPAMVYEDIKSKINALSTSTGEWVSVADRLPKIGEVVLIAFKNGNVKSDTVTSNGKHSSPWKSYSTYNVTHWQALPPAPTK